MGSVIIKDGAFVSIVASVIEVYRRESYGIILGKQKGEDMIIYHALPFQTAKRGYTSAYLTYDKEHAMNQVLECMSKQRLVGDYHSHPGKWVTEYLSAQDKKDMAKRGTDYVSLLIAIKKAHRYQKWKHNKDQSISGTIGKYIIRFKAYEYTQKDGKVRRVPIKIPYLTKLNTTFCEINQFLVKGDV